MVCCGSAMRVFLVALLGAALGHLGSAWRFRAFRRGIVAGALVAGGMVLPVLADLDEDADVGAVVARPISFVSVEAGTTNSAARAKQVDAQNEQDDSSYLSSLAREQKKQESQKKTKAQRAKDLCEKLGRGC